MIEKIDGLEAEDERWIAMLLEDCCSKQCSLEAMCSSRAYNAAKSAHRVTCCFSIVRQIVEPPLYRERSAQLIDEPPLTRSELERGRSNFRCAGETGRHYCFFSSIVQTSLCRSPMVK